MQFAFIYRLRFLCTADACASYVQAHIYSDLSYKRESTVSRDPTSQCHAEESIYNHFFCLINKGVIRILNFIISISKSIRGGEGAQKACHAQGKRKKEES